MATRAYVGGALKHRKNHAAVVINADDFGYSTAVNQAISTALAQGCISSATVMANAPATAEAVALSRLHPKASFGVHLNLTEFGPLSDPEPLQRCGLLTASGSFAGAIAIRRLPVKVDLLRACHRELDAQIRHLQELGLQPSHLDSHHHVHTIPWLLPVIRRLQRRHGLWKLRNTMNVYPAPPAERPPRRRLLGKRCWQLLQRLGGSSMTQVFSDLELFLADPQRPEFSRAASIELMCHPGQSGFEAETRRLLAAGPPLLDPTHFRLVSYHAL